MKLLLIFIFLCVVLLECKSQVFICSGNLPSLPYSNIAYSPEREMQYLKSECKITSSDTTKAILMGSAYGSVKNNTDSLLYLTPNLQLMLISNKDTALVRLDDLGYTQKELSQGETRMIINRDKYDRHTPAIDTSFILHRDTLYYMHLRFFKDGTYKIIGPVPKYKISDINKYY